MPDDFAVVPPEEVPAEPFPESGALHRKLTGPLGCTEMRVNVVTLEPGQSTAPHTHHRQEEVYVAVDGGHVEVDGSLRRVPAGGLVRIGPGRLRCVRNRSEEPQTWLMLGAPPVGSTDDYGGYAMPGDDGPPD